MRTRWLALVSLAACKRGTTEGTENTAPTVNITSPSDGAYVTGVSLTVVAEVSDSETPSDELLVWLAINNDVLDASTAWTGNEWTWVGPALSAGSHTISVFAQDPDGLSGADSLSLVWLEPDTDAPDTDSDVDTAETDAPEVDFDGDGFAALGDGGDDCDDANPEIFPGATEVCDGVDNNCNITADENLTFLSYWVDGDIDGYGALGTDPVSACAPIVGWVTNSLDCNDNAPELNPGNPEVCDGLDNDCDSQIDGPPLVWADHFLDDDGDGFGAELSLPISACEPLVGYSDNDLDCDDSDADISPNGTEICDGFDNDCNDESDEGLPTSSYWLDTDGDGWGTGSVIQTCLQPPQTAVIAGDCVDDNFLINPGEAESCGNGVDDDCAGGDAMCTTLCGLYTEDLTLGAGEWYITCQVHVEGPNTPTLTIEPGATLTFAPGSGIRAGWSDEGQVVINGPVKFEAEDPTPGSWEGFTIGTHVSGGIVNGLTIENAEVGIFLDGDAQLENVEIRNSKFDGLIANGSNSDLKGLWVHNNAVRGFNINSSSLRISDSIIEDNGAEGIGCGTYPCLDDSWATFENNVVTGNAIPMALPGLRSFAALSATSDYSGNDTDKVRLTAPEIVDVEQTWEAINVPVQLAIGIAEFGALSGPTPTITFNGGLEVEVGGPGATSNPAVRFGTNGRSANWVVDGTPSNPVTIRASSGFEGLWSGNVAVGDQAIAGLVIEDAQAFQWQPSTPLILQDVVYTEVDGGLRVQNPASTVTIDGCTVSGGFGLAVSTPGGPVSIAHCTISNSAAGGIVVSPQSAFDVSIADTVVDGANWRGISTLSPTALVNVEVTNAGDGDVAVYLDSLTQFANNSITGNSGLPLHISWAEGADKLDTLSTLTGNTDDRIRLGPSNGYIGEDFTLKNLGIPYLLHGAIAFGGPNHPAVVFEPGVEIQAENPASSGVNLVFGSPTADPVTVDIQGVDIKWLTAFSPNDVDFRPTADGIFAGNLISGGSYSGYGAVAVSSTAVEISDNDIENTVNSYGLWCMNGCAGYPLVYNNRFQNNTLDHN